MKLKILRLQKKNSLTNLINKFAKEYKTAYYKSVLKIPTPKIIRAENGHMSIFFTLGGHLFDIDDRQKLKMARINKMLKVREAFRKLKKSHIRLNQNDKQKLREAFENWSNIYEKIGNSRNKTTDEVIILTKKYLNIGDEILIFLQKKYSSD